MESSGSMVNPADGVVSMEVPWWNVAVNGCSLDMDATVTMRRSQDMRPPQLIFHFHRRTISPFTHAVENVNLDIHQPYQNIIHQATWEVETMRMLCHVMDSHVPTADLDHLVIALRRYTRAVLRHFLFMELSTMEFRCVIAIRPAAPPSNFVSRLHHSVILETHRIVFQDDNDNIEPIRGPTLTRTAAVEGLRLKISEKPDVCSICLDDFDVATEVLEMPCRHIFHNACLRKWLCRNNTCPLCRFTLLPDVE